MGGLAPQKKIIAKLCEKSVSGDNRLIVDDSRLGVSSLPLATAVAQYAAGETLHILWLLVPERSFVHNGYARLEETSFEVLNRQTLVLQTAHSSVFHRIR